MSIGSIGADALRRSDTAEVFSMEINEEDLHQFIEDLLDEFDNFYYQWLRLEGAWVLRESLMSFDRQKRTGAQEKYQELSRKYARHKELRGRSPLANFWSGAMRRSITLSGVGGTGAGLVGLAAQARVGTNIVGAKGAPYPAYIHRGTHRNGSVFMPARPFLPTVEAAERQGTKIAEDLVMDLVDGYK